MRSNNPYLLFFCLFPIVLGIPFLGPQKNDSFTTAVEKPVGDRKKIYPFKELRKLVRANQEQIDNCFQVKRAHRTFLMTMTWSSHARLKEISVDPTIAQADLDCLFSAVSEWAVPRHPDIRDFEYRVPIEFR